METLLVIIFFFLCASQFWVLQNDVMAYCINVFTSLLQLVKIQMGFIWSVHWVVYFDLWYTLLLICWYILYSFKFCFNNLLKVIIRNKLLLSSSSSSSSNINSIYQYIALSHQQMNVYWVNNKRWTSECHCECWSVIHLAGKTITPASSRQDQFWKALFSKSVSNSFRADSVLRQEGHNNMGWEWTHTHLIWYVFNKCFGLQLAKISRHCF